MGFCFEIPGALLILTSFTDSYRTRKPYVPHVLYKKVHGHTNLE